MRVAPSGGSVKKIKGVSFLFFTYSVASAIFVTADVIASNELGLTVGDVGCLRCF